MLRFQLFGAEMALRVCIGTVSKGWSLDLCGEDHFCS